MYASRMKSAETELEKEIARISISTEVETLIAILAVVIIAGVIWLAIKVAYFYSHKDTIWHCSNCGLVFETNKSLGEDEDN